MAKTSQNRKKGSRRPSMLAALKGTLTGGAVASLALCLVTPVFCLLSSPALTAALQGASVQQAMADDLGATVTPPAEEARNEAPAEVDAALDAEQGESEAASSNATDPEGQNDVETPAPDEEAAAEPGEEEAPDPAEAPLDPCEATPGAETLQEAPDPEAYLDSPVPREEDLPIGPDTTRAVESGMPVEGGVSAEPIEALIQTIEEQASYGSGAVALQIDGTTGTVEYL